MKKDTKETIYGVLGIIFGVGGGTIMLGILVLISFYLYSMLK